MNEYARHLYSNDLEGYIQVMRLNSREVIKIYNTELEGIREIVQEQQGQQDTFISPNSFFIPKRGNGNIRHYRALYIDLDLKEYSKTEAVYQIYILIGRGTIPEPTMIVDSGRGIHCYWRIEHAPVQAKYTWQELEDYLYKQLKHLGADLGATDGARVLRLPGTINSRNNELCKIIRCNNKKYSMYKLREKHLNYKPKKEYKPKRSRPRRKVKHIFNSYTLHMARAGDMETLCLLRQYRMTGYRNKLLHCFIYWKGIYIRNSEELQAVATRFNNNFTEPLTDAEVKATVKSTIAAIEKFIDYEQGLRSGEDKRVSKAMRERGGYWYTNERLIEMLNITDKEQQHLKTIISKGEKQRRQNEARRKARRNDQGLTTREQSKADNVKAVQELAGQGLTQTEIADKAGISQQYVSKILISNQKYN